MDQNEQLKRTEEDTTNILLEYIFSAQQVADEPKTKTCCKIRSRTKSVDKARALLIVAAGKQLQTEQQGVVITEPETEDGFVVLSTEPGPITQATSAHISTVRPSTLALQAGADPGDPPLFSPCQSYPPLSSGIMPMHVSQSSPTLPSYRCNAVIVPSCQQATAPHAQMATDVQILRYRSRLIADRLRSIGDQYEKSHNMQKLEDEFDSLLSMFQGYPNNGSLWQNVTRVFRSLHELSSQLFSAFGARPPIADERWLLFQKTMRLLRENIVPLISSQGGWGTFLNWDTELRSPPAVTSVFGSPLFPRCQPQTILTTHSSPILLSQTDQNRRRFLQDYQPSPGSTRSLRLIRSNTLPTKCEHPRKLWRLSESGSLIDEDGNEDFEESLKRETDLEGSNISLDDAGKIAETSSLMSDSERDELVFPMQNDETVVSSSPVIVSSRGCREKEFFYDSGIVSSLETLSISSTSPKDSTFVLGSAPLHITQNDSAIDLDISKAKKRPRSGCSFPSKPKEDLAHFDRARSRSVPMSSRRPRGAGYEKKTKKSSVVVSSHPPCETTFNSGSVTLSISEAVVYEAVCSLMR